MDKTKICIGRTGTFTDSSGKAVSFTTDDFDILVNNYKPETLEAPLVFGHPQTSSPAYGWVKSLSREGEKLFAYLAQIPASVRDLVHNGHYKYVSMSLSGDKKNLRHIGLLGAVPPAIDGLGAVELSADSTITIELNKEVHMPEDNGNNELKAKIADLEAKVKTAEEEIAKKDMSLQSTTAEFAAYKNDLAEKIREEKLEQLLQEGKIEPSQKPQILSFAKAIAGQTFKASDDKSMDCETWFFSQFEKNKPSDMLTNFANMTQPSHVLQAIEKQQLPNITQKL